MDDGDGEDHNYDPLFMMRITVKMMIIMASLRVLRIIIEVLIRDADEDDDDMYSDGICGVDEEDYKHYE